MLSILEGNIFCCEQIFGWHFEGDLGRIWLHGFVTESFKTVILIFGYFCNSVVQPNRDIIYVCHIN